MTVQSDNPFIVSYDKVYGLQKPYCILDQELRLATHFKNSEDVPVFIKKIDEEEEKILSTESNYIKNYCGRPISLYKLSFALIGTGISICISALSCLAIPVLEVALINTICTISAIAGYILGYIAAYKIDMNLGCSKTEALFIGGISEKRIERLNFKIKLVSDAIEKESDKKVKEALLFALNSLNKAIDRKENYSAVRDFLNI